MSSSTKSAMALSIICLIGCTNPVFAQISSNVEPLDEVGKPSFQDCRYRYRHKFSDFTGSVYDSDSLGRHWSGSSSSGAFRSAEWHGSREQLSSYYKPVSSNPILCLCNEFHCTKRTQATNSNDSQTVGRLLVWPVPALILGAFLKNGGVGGMMNTFGLDNRFHSRGPSMAPY